VLVIFALCLFVRWNFALVKCLGFCLFAYCFSKIIYHILQINGQYVIAKLSYHELQIYHYLPSTQTHMVFIVNNINQFKLFTIYQIHMVCILNNINQFKLFTIYQTHMICILNNINQFKLFTIYQTHMVCMSFSNKVYILFLSPT